MTIGTKTIYLGTRESFLDRLDRALDAEHAVSTEISRQTIGVHQITTWEVDLHDGILIIEDDAYLGKSLTGPVHLVDRLASLAFGIDR